MSLRLTDIDLVPEHPDQTIRSLEGKQYGLFSDEHPRDQLEPEKHSNPEQEGA